MRACHALGVFMGLVLCTSAGAQVSAERARTWEAGFHIVDMSSVSVSDSFGASIDVDGDLGYGFTGAYNFTNRFAVMLDYNTAHPDYVATFVPDSGGAPQTIATQLDVSTLQAKGVFYFLEGDVTPFVEVGLGWTNLDSNIINGPPITGCWWDFFWGYICQSYYDTYDRTETSYSANVGIRWDFTPEFMLRGSIGTLKLDVESGEDPSVDMIQFDFAWRY